MAGTHETSHARLVGAGVLLLLIGAAAGAGLTWRLIGDSRTEPIARDPASAVSNGWVAFSDGSDWSATDVYLVKEGAPAHRVLGSGDLVSEVCPSFSPDGTQLAAGKGAGHDDLGWEDVAVVFGDVTPDGGAARVITLPLEGATRPPCPIWSADGRWLALVADTDTQQPSPPVTNEVWLVETQTLDTRRLTGLRATDIEWSPIASELFIATDDIRVYSIATAETRPVEGTDGAAMFAVSPDGRSLAVQRFGVEGRSTLWLMGVDGSDRKLLADGYTASSGIGPVWSPDGNRVVFQRLCDTYLAHSGEERPCDERHDGVVVAVTDRDPWGPFGTQKVIPPLLTDGGGWRVWSPNGISWSPDSSMLLYVGWSWGIVGPGSGILAVPPDGAAPPVLLTDARNARGGWGSNWARERSPAH